jgi:glycosyltransferase involved in cell wall biosynthesis
MEMNVIAVIPCLNEDRFIADIVVKARKYVNKVIVVDDGSNDKTAEVAGKSGAEVIKHAVRQGAGAATRSGFDAAWQAGADIVVTLDGDGQHNPDEIPSLLKPLQENTADFVIGSRFLGEARAPEYRRLGINIITWLYNFGHKKKIIDSQSGFRAFNRLALSSMHITYAGFGFSIECLVQARKRKLRISEVPISCIYHDFGSTESPWIHGLSVAMAVVEIRLKEELFHSRGIRKG